MNLAVFFMLFFALLLIGVPIYMSMLVPSVLYLVINDMSLLMIAQKCMNGLNSFTLIAIPFFIMAAQVMNSGSVTNRIFDFCRSLVGHFKGGLGYVNVLASVIFSGMSGSAVADVGGLGQVEIKAMRDSGYDEGFTIGVTAASGTIGPIIPPSIPTTSWWASMTPCGTTGSITPSAWYPARRIYGYCAVLYVPVYGYQDQQPLQSTGFAA